MTKGGQVALPSMGTETVEDALRMLSRASGVSQEELRQLYLTTQAGREAGSKVASAAEGGFTTALLAYVEKIAGLRGTIREHAARSSLPDLEAEGPAVLRRQLTYLGLPSSGTAAELARRLYDHARPLEPVATRAGPPAPRAKAARGASGREVPTKLENSLSQSNRSRFG